MALIGSITNWGEIQGQINDANGVLTGVISSAELLGGEIVGLRGLKGDKGDKGDTGEAGTDGQDGTDGFSPSASVSKVGDTATITITDKDGTSTAEVHDGHDGNVFIVELGETTFQEVVDAADDGAIVLLHVEIISTGDKQYYALAQIASHRCVFVCQRGKEIYFYFLNDNNSWDSQTYTFITTETDPTVPSWAKQATKPTYTASEVGAQEILVSGTNIKTINNTSLLGSGNINIQGGGASAFIAEYGVTTYADVKDAYDEDATIICTVDDSGNTAICQLAYYDDANDLFYFAQPQSDGFYLAIIASDDTWDDGYFHFASTDTATQLRDGLMSALDWQKLDGIASGAEVNVQSDWNQSISTADDYIKNKPTIPSKTSDLNNDVPFATTDTATTVANGLMSSSDKSKLDGIESGAEVNYVTKITQHFISDPSDPQYVYPRSATIDYNAVGINDVELLTKDALGEFNGVCDLDASSKVPKSRLPSTSTPTADEVSEFDSDAHMNSTDMTTGSGSELEDFIDGLNVSGGLLGDYVVEQGTNNGWTYRKWNSGTFDAWQSLTHNSAVQTAWGSLYASAVSGNIELPSFADKAGWVVAGTVNGGDIFRPISKTSTQSPPYFTYTLASATSRAASARNVSLIVHGTWS